MLTAPLQNSMENKRIALPSAFLQKTFEILESSDYSNIIAWNKEGDAFSVKDAHGFSEKVLPKYFKHSNYQSFVRQLNMYDFHKYRKNDESFFKHPYFKRGSRHLMCKIKRKTNVNFISSLALQDYVGPHISPEIKDMVMTLKSKQEELEDNLSYLISQNYHLMNENRKLWSELLKQKVDKEDSKEKLLYFMLQNASQGRAHNAIGPSPFNNTTTTESYKSPAMGWSLSGEQDCLMQRLFSNLHQNSSPLLSPFSKSIKKNKKLRNLSKAQNKFRTVSEAFPGNENGLFDGKIQNLPIEDDKSNLEDPVFYNLASPSSFLNIETFEKQNAMNVTQNFGEDPKNEFQEQNCQEREEVFVPIFEEIKE